MAKICPYCGARLPEEAAFCPLCAQDIHPRRELRPPVHLWRKALRPLMVLLAAAAVVLGGYYLLTPNTYNGYGQVTYRDSDGTYQLLITPQTDRFTPKPLVEEQAEVEGEYRFPCRLFVNHVDSGANAGQMFVQKIAWAQTEFIQDPDNPSPFVCSQPRPMDMSPEAALVSLVDYTGRSTRGELVWTLKMNNGDTITLRQTISVTPIETLDYYPEDYPMETTQQLQALVDQICQEVPLPTVVNLHLPPATYGGLTIEGRPINLYGSAEGGRRTTFTDTLRLPSHSGPILYCYDIDFKGSGDGIAVSTAAQYWAEGCTFSDWRTGMLIYGNAWGTIINCQFAGNQVGFHFNSSDNYVIHCTYNDNIFEGNDTAVLLEQVPGEETLSFEGCRFSGNQLDIDNRCGHPLDITQAIFE